VCGERGAGGERVVARGVWHGGGGVFAWLGVGGEGKSEGSIKIAKPILKARCDGSIGDATLMVSLSTPKECAMKSRLLCAVVLAAGAAVSCVDAQQVIIQGGGPGASQPVDPAKLDQELVAEMRAIFEMDQSVRGRIRALGLPPGIPLPDVFVEEWDENDRQSEERLRAVVAKHGWPVRSKAGEQGALAAFLVVQHASLETQREFLPVVQKAVEDGELRGDTLAYLTDRIALGEGKQQVYGTQVGFDVEGSPIALNLADPEQVDERRETVGLPPLGQYLSSFKERPSGGTSKFDPAGIDQELRAEFTRLQSQYRTTAPVSYGGGVTKDEKTWPSELREKRRALRENIAARIDAVLKERGYPTPALVGEDGSRAFFNLLSNADVAVQERALERMQGVEGVPKAQVAWLTDKVRRATKRPQVYGTQVVRGADGRVEAYTIEEPKTVDERREAVGLNALSQYLAVLNGE
jgi:hypothetical protein